MKIAIVTCYDQNDYVRARTLRAAFKAAPGVRAIIMRNEYKSAPARYFEMMWRILKTRFTVRPDAYVITFRGFEMLLYMVLTGVRKPIIFDEMINLTEWLTEHHKIKPGSLKYGLFRSFYGWLTRRSRLILADTDAHAELSAKLNGLNSRHYLTIPIGSDETVFHPQQVDKTEPFTVFYYGHMLPLHGLQHVLDAAVLLADRPGISFRFVGGKRAVAAAVKQAQKAGAHVTHEAWIPFEDLPKAALEAGLTVGGPFGDTLQSQYVITGKTYQFLALGAPVLIGKNQVNDLFTDKENCLLVPQADAGAIADAILWAHDHPKELTTIANNGRRLYEQHFSQAEINKLVADLVSKITV